MDESLEFGTTIPNKRVPVAVNCYVNDCKLSAFSI